MTEKGSVKRAVNKWTAERDIQIDRMFLEELEKAKQTVSVASQELSTKLQAVFTS